MESDTNYLNVMNFSSTTYTTWLIVISYFILSLFVSFLVSKRDDLERMQKVAQILIIWIFPFFAAVGIWLFHRNSDREPMRLESFARRSKDESMHQG